MISTDMVISLAHSFYGIDENESGVRALCSVVCTEIKQMMKQNTDDADVRILILCAAKLNLRLCQKSSDEDKISSFEAGDVSVTLNPSARRDYAERELDEALASAAPLLIDGGFTFRQVRV